MTQPVVIPACFEGDELAPDLPLLASYAGLPCSAVVRLFCSTEFTVDFLGFVPGFAYLKGLPASLHAPRLESPRPRVPAGSVGIAGQQAGVYPLATPGGWRLIGRTPLRMFDPRRTPPTLLAPGAAVRFQAITRAEFDDLLAASSSLPIAEPARADTLVMGRGASPAPVAWLTIIHPGLQTTVQDLGRPGYSHLGVSHSGAGDQQSLRIANRLVGNADSAAGLECTLLGPTLEASDPINVAVAGAAASCTLTRADGTMHELPLARAVTMLPGERLKVAATLSGARTYIAFAGGVATELLLGSRSTHLMSSLGGVEGRALRAGDRLPIGAEGGAVDATGEVAFGSRSSPAAVSHWLAGRAGAGPLTLRVLRGPQWSNASAADHTALTTLTFTVLDRSDRTGLRLSPGSPLSPAMGGQMASQPTFFGYLQWPDGGQPILLGPDAPPTGGYPVLARVIAADLPLIGQLKPRDVVRFMLVTQECADGAHRAQAASLDALIAPHGATAR